MLLLKDRVREVVRFMKHHFKIILTFDLVYHVSMKSKYLSKSRKVEGAGNRSASGWHVAN